MLKWMCAVALAASVAAPAMAQKPADRPMKRIKEFDLDAIREGITTLNADGQCTVTYIVSTKGRAKDIAADCSVSEFAPYAIRAVEAAEWQPEIFDGELWESDPIKQVFKFGSAPAVDPRGEKAPEIVKNVEPKEVARAINKIDQEGRCDVKFTVGADGKPKDIEPHCAPDVFDPLIAEAVSQMEFTPGEKGGQPTDWQGLIMPMNLTKPEN
jgi:hypothetical protein